MTEREWIRCLTAGLPRPPEQINALFEADAEILRLGSELWAVTTDEFSAEEDAFGAAPPELIGWNVVAATLSDLFSVGAVPRFYLSVVCLPRGAELEFAEGLATGMRDALARAGAFLVGGDVGQGSRWRCTGTAFGPIPQARPLTRAIHGGEHGLWVTGALGAANLAAARGEPPPRLPLPLEPAALIREAASACVDTSGGFLAALWDLHEAGPDVRFDVDLDAVPLAPGAAAAAARFDMPVEAVLMGGAGEYELLFAVPIEMEPAWRSRLDDTGAVRIGTAEACGAGGIVLSGAAREPVHLTAPPPCPRAGGSVVTHLAEVGRMVRALFPSRGPQ